MKPEFTEVLLPQGKGKYPSVGALPMEPEITPTIQLKHTNNVSCTTKRLFIIIIVGFVVLVLTGTGLITRYESKFAKYENRISALENQLALFFEDLDQEVLHHHTPTPADFLVRIHDSGSYEDQNYFGIPFHDESDEGLDNDEDDENEAEKIVFGEVKKTENRRKREALAYQGSTTESNVERNSDGVAIIEGSYGAVGGSGKNDLKSVTPTESGGLRLYESLITTGGHGEPKAPEFAESEGSNIRPYHRTSAAWIDENETPGRGRRRLEVKSGDNNLQNTPSRYGETGFNSRVSSPYSQHYSGSIASRRRASLPTSNPDSSASGEYLPNPNMIVRNSRVPVTTGQYVYPRNNQHLSSYPYPPLRKIGQGDGEVIARVHQENKDLDEDGDPEEASVGADHGESSAFAISRTHKGGYSQGSGGRVREDSPRRHPSRKVNPSGDEELSIVQAEAWAEGPKTVSAHYVADSSNFSLSHRHYEGNGRLRNADGIFSSWKASDWMSVSEGAKEFALSPTGVLTVKKEGIYYIYAQIHYLDTHDVNGFALQVNTEPFLQCTRMTETVSGTTTKSNSCFTAGINHLKVNDRILIRDIETNRFSIIKPEKTFFGLMRIGDVGRR